jgi:lipopolysaccharide transport system ATP-binding protein
MTTLTVERLSKCYYVGKLGKGYREVWALKDVSLEVDHGTILGVVGPNGAGKTTLLKILARVTLPTEGRVVGRGRVVSLLELGAGFNPELSARENIFMNAAMYGIARSEVQRRFDDIVAFAEIEEAIDNPLKFYSSGMYLRLAFSVAINMDPQILLADEILAVGDLSFQERCLERVAEAGRAGLTVLFVSHDMAAITRLCDRVMWLQAGEIVKIGRTEDVVNDYQNASWSGSARSAKGTSHRSEYGEILSVKLVSSAGLEIGAAKMTEAALVRVALRLSRGMVGIRCGFDVYTRGIQVFRSLQPEPVVGEEPGVYEATARIPANLLSETIYSLNVSVTIVDEGREHYLVLYNALSFRVYDVDESRSARGQYFKGRLGGVVTPKLEWSLTRERSVVGA